VRKYHMALHVAEKPDAKAPLAWLGMQVNHPEPACGGTRREVDANGCQAGEPARARKNAMSTNDTSGPLGEPARARKNRLHGAAVSIRQR
jgi:hypothetical protein